MNWKRTTYAVVAILILLFVGLRPVRWINRTWQDSLANWAPPLAPSGQVVVVAIDDATIAKFGTWPWHRGQTGQLFTAIASCKAKVLVFDGWFLHRPIPMPGDTALSDSLARIVSRGTKVILPLEMSSPTNIPSPDDTLPVAIPEILRTSAFQLLPDKPKSDNGAKTDTKVKTTTTAKNLANTGDQTFALVATAAAAGATLVVIALIMLIKRRKTH